MHPDTPLFIHDATPLPSLHFGLARAHMYMPGQPEAANTSAFLISLAYLPFLRVIVMAYHVNLSKTV